MNSIGTAGSSAGPAPAPARAPAPAAVAQRWLAVALLALAAGLGANSLLGPLAVGAIEYHYSTAMINQGIGLDAVALLLAVPIAVAAALLLLRGHAAGLVLAFAPATFAGYMMPQYVIGPDYLGLPGNNQQYVLFHLMLFVLAAAVVIGAWTQLGIRPLPPDSSTGDRRRALILLGLCAFTALGRWLPALPDAVSRSPSASAYLDNPTAFWLVAFLDLGIIVPFALTTAFALRQGRAWARKAGYAVIGWFSLVPASVAAMAITMQVNDDPLATPANTVIMTVAGVVFTAGAALLYRPLFVDPWRASAHLNG